VLETQAALQAGSVALTLRVITFCWASSESLEPPPQPAKTLPIMPNTKLFAILILMFPSSSRFMRVGTNGRTGVGFDPTVSTGPRSLLPLQAGLIQTAAIFFQLY